MRFAGTALTNFMGDGPDFTKMGQAGLDSQTMQRNSATQAEGLVHGAGINSLAQVAGAGYKADAIVAGGQAQGQQAMASGIGSMFSGLASGFG